jgi:selenocysteine lyase/cysteine desulfurase
MKRLATIKSFLRRSFQSDINKSSDDLFFDQLRRKEFSRIDQLGHTYLDYTGGNVYPDSLVKSHYAFLRRHVYGNPHSTNPASLLSEKLVNAARNKVLSFFNASDYYCIFTSNATAALQIVGESYPFSGHSHLLLTSDNHNSVNGIREYCRRKGGQHSYAPMNYEDLRINEKELNKHLDAHADKGDKLFAYPAQSNVSGVRHSLSWIQRAHEKGWDVLLDAAAFVPTSKLDLSVVHPDFVCLSFYKMFGYPTGIGCLLVRKSRFHKLRKPAYAGGTITISSVGYNGYFFKTDHEKFENGTVNYLGIPAICNGLTFIDTIGIERIHDRVNELSKFFIAGLKSLRHNNQLPLVKLYGPTRVENRGGTFLMNFFDVNGNQYPFQLIEEMANKEMISCRTGCFCNPGIDELNNCLSPEQLKDYFVSRDMGDYDDFIAFTKQLRGAVRISIGLATTKSDLEKFFRFSHIMLNKEVTANQSFRKLPAATVSLEKYYSLLRMRIPS